MLIALTLVSIYFTWRNRVAVGDDSPATTASVQSRLPQVLFTVLLVVVTAVFVMDVHDTRYLTRFFPLTVAAITGGMLLVSLGLMLARPRGAVMYDAEAENIGRGLRLVPTMRYVGWLIGLPILSSLIGFYLAAPLFVALFLRIEGRAGWLSLGLGAVGITVLLKVMSNALTLRYPQGLLQRFVDLPGFLS